MTASAICYAGKYDANAVTKSCAEGDIYRVKRMLSSGVDLTLKNDKGWFPLSVAAAHGQLDTVKLLIKAGADVNELTTKKNTPLIFAASRGHMDVVIYLLDQGANPKLKAKDGDTAYASARRKEYKAVAKFIKRYKKGRTRRSR